jgi:RimJ/RimL family protein N-acetyltransferase
MGVSKTDDCAETTPALARTLPPPQRPGAVDPPDPPRGRRPDPGLLGPEEIRQRFLYALTELTPEMAHRLSHPDPQTEFALVAAEPLPPGDALVGAVARASVTSRTRDAEFAILVSHFIAGQGLGRHLMRRLVKWAKSKKLEHLYGDVLDSNQPMLKLAESLGFHRVREHDTPGLVRVVLNLEDQ